MLNMSPSVGRLAALVRERKGLLAGLSGLAVAGSLAEAFTAVGLGWSVSGMTDADMTLVGVAALFIATLVGVRISSSVVAHNLTKRAEIALGITLKQRIGDHLASVASTDTRRIPVGVVVETASEDTDTVASLVSVSKGLIASFVTFLGVGVYLLSESFLLGAIVLLSAPILALGLPRLTSRLGRRLKAQRTLESEVAGLAADAAIGARVLRGMSAGPTFATRFRATSTALFETGLHVAGLRALIEGAKVFIPTAVLVVVLFVGVGEIDRGALTLPQLVTFYGLGLALVPSCSTFVSAIQDVSPILVALDRIDAVLRTGAEESAGPESTATTGLHLLRDPESGVIARPGVFTAVTSSSTSGLQEAASRMAGLSDDAGASAVLGNRKVTETGRATMRQSVLLAEGDAYLFSGTVRQTLADGHAVSRSETVLLRAISVACAEDALVSTGGLDGHLSEGGRNLSGGQRQRLALARALVRDAPTLILFEPTNAVDVATESRIAAGVREFREGRTTLVFSNSPAFSAVADEVIALRDEAEAAVEGARA